MGNYKSVPPISSRSGNPRLTEPIVIVKVRGLGRRWIVTLSNIIKKVYGLAPSLFLFA